MQPKEHANLLNIFLWVFAGLQGLFTIIWFGVAGFMGFAMFSLAQENRKGAQEGELVFGLMIGFFALFALAATFATVINIIAGYGLRNEKPWAKTIATIASITSIMSFMFMGIWAFPIAVAVGVYGLWFIFGDLGKLYFSNPGATMNYSPQMLNQGFQPPIAPPKPQNQDTNYYNWR